MAILNFSYDDREDFGNDGCEVHIHKESVGSDGFHLSQVLSAFQRFLVASGYSVDRVIAEKKISTGEIIETTSD